MLLRPLARRNVRKEDIFAPWIGEHDHWGVRQVLLASPQDPQPVGPVEVIVGEHDVDVTLGEGLFELLATEDFDKDGIGKFPPHYCQT